MRVRPGQGPGELEGPLNDGAVDVPESIWKVSYGVAPKSTGLDDLVTMAALAGGAGLALLLTIFLQWRMLSRDLRADMSTVVNLGEAILRREGSPARQAHLAAASDAIALLGQYARRIARQRRRSREHADSDRPAGGRGRPG